MDMSDFQELYNSESREHLDILNDSLLTLENEPGNMEMINESFRAAHTLKGMAGTMGFDDVSRLAHVMENILDLLRDEKMVVDTEVINILFKAVDNLELLSNSPEDVEDLDGLVAELKAYSQDGNLQKDSVKGDQSSPKDDGINFVLSDEEIQVIEKSENKLLVITIKLEDDCVFKSLRADMVFEVLEEYGELIRVLPGIEEIRKEEVGDSFSILFSKKSDIIVDDITEPLTHVSEVDRVKVDLVEDINDLREEDKEDEERKDKAKEKTKKTSLSKKLKSKSTIRVDVERLDSLMNLVAELVIKRTQVESVGVSYDLDELNKKLKPLGKVTTELQNAVMEMRMVPISLVFNRFPRLVRDLGQGLNKDINLVIEGEDTELDRTIVDEIGDPLVHMLRNAIDHGVESPEQREKAGKKKEGLVKLSAFHEGNNVVIQIQDDGKGINPDIIRNKVIEKGVLTAVELEGMSDSEVIKLIFAPGFSTNEEISDVSGRGVGMDVVKTKIESLSGSVDIVSEVGIGSTFTMKLPLTLSIIQGFLTKVAGQEYVIPLESIQEIVDVNPKEIQTVRNQQVIHRRGSVIPLISLRKKLNKEELKEEVSEIATVILEVGDDSYGLMVDSIIGQQEVVIKRINDLSENLQKIAGGAILGDGNIALIINVDEITTN